MKTLYAEKTFSKGFTVGKAFVVEKQCLQADTYTVATEEEVEQEIEKYKESVEKAEEQLNQILHKSDIFQGHLMLLKDVALYDSVINKIKEEKMNVEMALEKTKLEFCSIFDAMEDEYMRERCADVKDVCNRILRCLKCSSGNCFEDIKEPVILIAEDLVPSDTADIDLSMVKGFITELGGVTSHVSIIAKSMGIPALVGIDGILESVKSGELIAMDASKGIIIIHPEEETVKEYEAYAQEFLNQKKELESLSELPAVTLDGRRVKVGANVGNIEDIKRAVKANADGIGLFRSEFLYMENTHFPTEEEQYQVYKQAAELCGKEVIIRTLDIGGDKGLPYYEFEKEENPFLGWRAIRISLELTEVFKTQLRAILRASAFGTIKIMYPMIISLEELIEANEILSLCKKELQQEGIAFDNSIKAGIMVETPAAVMNVELLARYADFFSIGTNDLTQYMLAVDRGNKKIGSMYNSFHPAVLRSIKKIIKAGHEQGLEVGMCGEFAGDEKAAKLLLGLGLDEFSMASGEVAGIKNIIRGLNYEEAKDMAEKAVSAVTIQEVMECLV